MKWADTGGGDFEPAPIGNHVARCVKIIDMGTQKGEYQGAPVIRRQVIIAWELPQELMTEGAQKGKPFLISKKYTASLAESATLRKDLESWRGRAFTPDELKGFDARNVLMKACMLSVIHTDKGKAKVSGVASVPKGLEVPPQVNKAIYFSLEPDEFSLDVYESLGKWHKEMIAQSPEYIQLVRGNETQEHTFSDMADNIVF